MATAPTEAKKISVVLCTYNGAIYLARQLESIAAQTRLPDELVAFDDCSSDASAQILHEFAAISPFPVKVQVNEFNLGSAKNFESAIQSARGGIIALCDQDDVWYPEKLAAIESAFSRNPVGFAPRTTQATFDEVALVFSDAHIVSSDLQPLGYRLWQTLAFGPEKQRAFCNGHGVDFLLPANVVTGAAMAFSSRFRDLVLPIESGWMHDGWIGLLLCAVGKCVPLPDPLLAYRQHSTQLVGGRRRSMAAQWEIARKMDRNYFQQLAKNFTAAADRLRNCGLAVRPGAIEQIESKAEHCFARAKMRDASLISRGSAIAGEILRGRYSKYSLGIKSIAQDVLLATKHDSE